MSGRPRTFDITLSNVPVINLRWEFREFYEASHRPHFLHTPGGKAKPLETRYFIWLGMSDAAAAMMVMRSIVGLEAYVCFAAHFSAPAFGKNIPAIAKAANDPFKLGGGTADNFYN